jgi:hypothetical protein
MSKASKHPGPREALRRWDNEGGAPRSGHHLPGSAPVGDQGEHHELYYFNIRTAGGMIEDPEGSVHPDLQAAREQALSEARRIVAEGDRQGEDRRSWSFEIMDRGNRPVLTIRFSDLGRAAGR